MTRGGKIAVIFLIALSGFLLCLGGYTFMLFQKESEEKIKIERNLKQMQEEKDILFKQWEESNAKLAQLDRDLAQARLKIDSLSEEARVLQRQLNEERKVKDEALGELQELRKKLSLQTLERKAVVTELVNKLSDAKDSLFNLYQRLYRSETIKEEIVDLGPGEGTAVELEKIVVSASEINGNVLVINKEYNFAILDVGDKDGIHIGDRLFVYQEGRQIGEVKVEKTYPSLSAANFVPPLNKEIVKEGDTVIKK